eukprot:4473501-Lingulodinium_polyedra.AAC.1
MVAAGWSLSPVSGAGWGTLSTASTRRPAPCGPWSGTGPRTSWWPGSRSPTARPGWLGGWTCCEPP